MAKKNNEYLDIEAMKMGYQMMLQDAKEQLKTGILQNDSIRTLLTERAAHIEKRLEELK